MYCKNFWFSPKKVVWEFQKIPRFAENQAFCMGTRVLLDSARVLPKFDQWSEYPELFREYCPDYYECFCYTFLLCVF